MIISLSFWPKSNQIIPYHEWALEVEIVQIMGQKPRKDKNEEIHTHILYLVFDSFHLLMIAVFDQFLHYFDASVGIFEILAEVSN